MKIERYIDAPPEREAGIAMQMKYAKEVIEYDNSIEDNVQLIAGVDGSYPPKTGMGYIGVVIIERETGKIIEESRWAGEITFPYIPGLLSLREVPPMLEAFSKLQNTPDLVIVDGHGKIHPRRFGLACHIGTCLEVPTIGCGKNPFVGEHEELANERGSTAFVYDGGEIIGKAIRSQASAPPIYISIGHKFSLDLGSKIALSLTAKSNRIPKPVFYAHNLCKQIRKDQNRE